MNVNGITALLLCVSLAAAAPARAGTPDAQRLDALAQRCRKRELTNSYALQMELGIPVRALRAHTAYEE